MTRQLTFTDAARTVLKTAQEEARRLGHPAIGTEHVLLGVLIVGSGPAARVLDQHVTLDDLRARLVGTEPELDAQALASVGVDLDAVRSRVEARFGRGALQPPPGRPSRRGHLRPTRRLRRALTEAASHRIRLGHDEIDQGHLLLGVLDDRDSLAARLLTDQRINLLRLRGELLLLMADQGAA